MVKDSVTGDIFRADHLVKAVLTTRVDDDAAIRLGRGIPKKPAGVKPAETITLEKKAEYGMILETLDNYQGEALGKLMKVLYFAYDRIWTLEPLKPAIQSLNQFFSI